MDKIFCVKLHFNEVPFGIPHRILYSYIERCIVFREENTWEPQINVLVTFLTPIDHLLILFINWYPHGSPMATPPRLVYGAHWIILGSLCRTDKNNGMSPWRSSLLCRHNGRGSVTIAYSTVYSMRRSKKTSKLRVTGLCAGNSPGPSEFPVQMASNAENVSLWWRHHDYLDYHTGVSSF